jgi:tRNA dimethylallyltransferase
VCSGTSWAGVYDIAKKVRILQSPKYLIIIGGATATGKTAIAIELAQSYGAEIVNADSRQFYREMCIGTARPSPQQCAAVPHHLIASRSITEPYSVGAYEQDALQILEQLFENQSVAIACGGSGLYLKALYEGLDVFPTVDEASRAAVDEGFREGGLPWLRQTIRQLDPAFYDIVDTANPARLRRALEVCYASGSPYSSFRLQQKKMRPFTSILIQLELPRSTLYARINNRVDDMIAVGLEAEVEALLPYRHLPALQTVGYTELFRYFDGEIGREMAIDLIRQHTRNFAKRQLTWFRNAGVFHCFGADDFDAIRTYIDRCRQNGI